MSALTVIWLVLEAILFAFWVVAMFRTLFRLRRDAVAESGRAFPGPGAALDSFAGFFRRADYARDRRRIGMLTLLLLAVSVLRLP